MAVHKPFVLLSFLMTLGLLFLCISLVDGQMCPIRCQAKKQVGVGERSRMSRLVGIHLGNMYSSVAVYKHPQADNMQHCIPGDHKNCGASSFYETMEVVVMNEHNATTIPSCVSFTNSGVLVGEPPKTVPPQQTVCGITRLIGRRFDNPEVQSYIKTLPYKVVNKDNDPWIEVEVNDGEIKLYSPIQICALIIGKMKEIAEKYMGSETSVAAILIHESYYDRKVRLAIYEAGNMSGLYEPIVGHTRCSIELVKALAWYKQDFKALIFHLGGGAFITEIVNMYNRENDVISTREDPNFGGQVFDTRLVDYFVDLIKNKYGKDISNDSNALRELRVECERAKISLSEIDHVIVKIEFRLVKDDEILVIEEDLTREKFEELNMDLFNRTIDMVKGVLEEGRINATDIDEIILLGRSTEIPMIQRLIKSYIGKDPLRFVKPKDALLFAATAHASYAARLSEEDYRVAMNPISLGIEMIGAVMKRFLEGGNSIFPGSNTRNVTTYYDGQTTMVIKVFEGERGLTKYCHYLGNLHISNLPPAPRGVTKVEVTLEVYEDEGIRVTAEHKPTHNRQSMVIPKEERNITEQLIQDSLEFAKNATPDTDAVVNIHYFYGLNNRPQPRSMGFTVKVI